jgi:putative ABC transport system permease protein
VQKENNLLYNLLVKLSCFQFCQCYSAIVATFLIVPLLNQFTGKSIEFNPFADPILGLIILAAGNCYRYDRRHLSRFSVIGFSTDKSFEEHEAYWQWRGCMVKTSFGCDPVFTFCVADRFHNDCLQANTVLNNTDIGFNKEQVVYFQVRGSLEKKLESFKSELKRSSNIVSITSGMVCLATCMQVMELKPPAQMVKRNVLPMYL